MWGHHYCFIHMQISYTRCISIIKKLHILCVLFVNVCASPIYIKSSCCFRLTAHQKHGCDCYE